MRLIYYLVFILIAFFSCKAGKDEQAGKLLEMKRTACLGTCPVYQVIIYKDRTIEYQGEQYVPFEGSKSFKLKSKDFKRLFKLIEDAQLNRYKDKYYQDNIHDLPTTYIHYYKDDKVKSIMDYYGAPESLRIFEKEIQNFVFKYLEQLKKQ